MIRFIKKSLCVFLSLFLLTSGVSVSAANQYYENLQPEYQNGHIVKKGFEFKNICSYVEWRKALNYEYDSEIREIHSFSHQYLHSLFVNYPQASEIVKIKSVQYASDMGNFLFNAMFIITFKNGQEKLVDFGHIGAGRNFSVYSKFIKYDERDYTIGRRDGYRPDVTSKEFETDVEDYDFFEQWFDYLGGVDGKSAIVALSEYYFDVLKMRRCKLTKVLYNTQSPDEYFVDEYNYEFLLFLRTDESYEHDTTKYAKISLINRFNNEAAAYKTEDGICARYSDFAEPCFTVEVFDKFSKDSNNSYVCKLLDRGFYSQVYNVLVEFFF